MKKIKYLLILFIMFIGINNIEAFDTTLKVYDYAQVLTATEEENLKKNINLFVANHNMDMAIVTVKYHDKANTMNYADDFYDFNGFGIGPNYDGVILVLDFTFWQNGDVWMSTTGRAIDVYTDVRINNILDSVVSKKNSGYYEMFNTFIEECNYYSKEGLLLPSGTKNRVVEKLFFEVVLALFISLIAILLLIRKNKMIKAAVNAAGYLVNNSLIINKRNDKFITTHTISERINDSSSSGGHSGSSTHRSSSGTSHGGGGRRL